MARHAPTFFSSLGGVALLLVPLCGACSRTDDIPPASNRQAAVLGAGPDLLSVGEVGRSRDYQLEVLETRRCTVAPHFSPPAGIVKFGVRLRIRGLGERDVPANPFYAQVHAANGNRFEPTLVGCSPQLPAQSVGKGSSSEGWVTFDLPQTAQGLKFVYRPVVIGVGTEELQFSLGRLPPSH